MPRPTPIGVGNRFADLNGNEWVVTQTRPGGHVELFDKKRSRHMGTYVRCIRGGSWTRIEPAAKVTASAVYDKLPMSERTLLKYMRKEPMRYGASIRNDMGEPCDYGIYDGETLLGVAIYRGGRRLCVHSVTAEALSYGVRCLDCGEWETACKCPDDTPVIENHCPECNEYESECTCT